MDDRRRERVEGEPRERDAIVRAEGLKHELRGVDVERVAGRRERKLRPGDPRRLAIAADGSGEGPLAGHSGDRLHREQDEATRGHVPVEDQTYGVTERV